MPASGRLRLDRLEQTDLAVDVVDGVDGFNDLRAEWLEVLRSSSSNSPFLTWEWLYSWWIHLGARRALQILTARRGDGRLVAVAPLCVSRRRWPWLPQLEFLGTGWAGSDYLDLIARRGYEEECATAFTAWADARAQTVRFDHLRPAALAATMGGPLAEAGWSGESVPAGMCPFATLRGHSWESYVETLRPSQRTRCRRYLNTLQNRFDVRFASVETECQRREVLTALMGFHEQRWKTRGGSTAFQTPVLRAFHYDFTSRALKAGWLRLFSLRLNGEIAAVTYCFHVNGRFYLYQHGFNPGFWHYSVGVVVLALTIRSAIEEGALEFDMLYGEEPYKSLWASEARQLERVELFPPHLSGRLHRCAVNAERRVRLLARRIFPR